MSGSQQGYTGKENVGWDVQARVSDAEHILVGRAPAFRKAPEEVGTYCEEQYIQAPGCLVRKRPGRWPSPNERFQDAVVRDSPRNNKGQYQRKEGLETMRKISSAPCDCCYSVRSYSERDTMIFDHS